MLHTEVGRLALQDRRPFRGVRGLDRATIVQVHFATRAKRTLRETKGHHMNPDRARIYMDHSATTPVDPRVIEAMSPYWNDIFGNSESFHSFGQARGFFTTRPPGV